MGGRGGQKSPKNHPHGLRIPPKDDSDIAFAVMGLSDFVIKMYLNALDPKILPLKEKIKCPFLSKG